MSENNNLNFSVYWSSSASASTTDQSLIQDCRRNNYTNPQENFPCTEKPSIDIENEVDEVFKEKITELSGDIQGAEHIKNN